MDAICSNLLGRVIVGNRCGHNPLTPRLFTPPKQHKPRKGLQLFARQRLDHFYSNPKQLLTNLRTVNGSLRKQRSERREAIYVVTSILLHYLDIATFRIGTPHQNGFFYGLSLSFIAHKAGWRLSDTAIKAIEDDNKRKTESQRGIKRVQRAISDLIQSGYLVSYRLPSKRCNNEFYSYPAKRKFTVLFFKHLGLSQQVLDKSQKIALQIKEKLHLKKLFKNTKKPKTIIKKPINTIKNHSLPQKKRLLLYELLKSGIPIAEINQVLQCE